MTITMKTIPFFLITDVCIKKEVTPLEFPLLDNVERSFLKIHDDAIYVRFCILSEILLSVLD